MKTHEGEPNEECLRCGERHLSASGQIINGFCRTCLTRPLPTPTSSPGDRLGNFSIDSITSPEDRKTSPKKPIVINPRPGLSPMDRNPHHLMDNRHLAMGGRYTMINGPPNMAAPGLPLPLPHTGSGLLPYPASLTWPKLLTPHF